MSILDCPLGNESWYRNGSRRGTQDFLEDCMALANADSSSLSFISLPNLKLVACPTFGATPNTVLEEQYQRINLSDHPIWHILQRKGHHDPTIEVPGYIINTQHWTESQLQENSHKGIFEMTGGLFEVSVNVFASPILSIWATVVRSEMEFQKGDAITFSNFVDQFRPHLRQAVMDETWNKLSECLGNFMPRLGCELRFDDDYCFVSGSLSAKRLLQEAFGLEQKVGAKLPASFVECIDKARYKLQCVLSGTAISTLVEQGARFTVFLRLNGSGRGGQLVIARDGGDRLDRERQLMNLYGHHLSKRKREVMNAFLEGSSTGEIADRLGIALRTAQNIRHRGKKELDALDGGRNTL